jgi:hypothetical protein
VELSHARLKHFSQHDFDFFVGWHVYVQRFYIKAQHEFVCVSIYLFYFVDELERVLKHEWAFFP